MHKKLLKKVKQTGAAGADKVKSATGQGGASSSSVGASGKNANSNNADEVVAVGSPAGFEGVGGDAGELRMEIEELQVRCCGHLVVDHL